MSRGYPSMTALLGLLAIAGYQNRDKSPRAAPERRRPETWAGYLAARALERW